MNIKFQAPLTRLENSGYKGWPLIKRVQRLAPVTFVWWASTQTGRQSTRFLHSVTLNRLQAIGASDLCPTDFYMRTTQSLADGLVARQDALLPRLPNGYAWNGPYLYAETPAAELLAESRNQRATGNADALTECVRSSGLLRAKHLADHVLAETGQSA